MLILSSVNDKVQLVTGSSGSIKVHASGLDNDNGTITPWSLDTIITTAATTDVVEAPGAGVQRTVELLSVRNDHAADSNAIICQHTDGTNVEPLWEGTLIAQKQVMMGDDGVPVTYDTNGIEEQIMA